MDLCMHDTLITGSFACLICGLTTGTKLTNEDVHEGVMHAKNADGCMLVMFGLNMHTQV